MTTASSPSSFTGDAACVPDVPGVVTSIGVGAGVGTGVGVVGGGIVILRTLLSNWGKSPTPTLATASSNSRHLLATIWWPSATVLTAENEVPLIPCSRTFCNLFCILHNHETMKCVVFLACSKGFVQ